MQAPTCILNIIVVTIESNKWSNLKMCFIWTNLPKILSFQQLFIVEIFINDVYFDTAFSNSNVKFILTVRLKSD